MAYRVVSEIIDADHVQPLAPWPTALARRTPAVLNGIVVFSENNIVAGEAQPDFIAAARRVEVDADPLTYNVGDVVYDDGVAPTGIVNKTSGGTRVAVGKVVKGVTLAAQGKLIIRFNGGL